MWEIFLPVLSKGVFCSATYATYRNKSDHNVDLINAVFFEIESNLLWRKCIESARISESLHPGSYCTSQTNISMGSARLCI